jgi:Flp pilus assembly protein TadD
MKSCPNCNRTFEDALTYCLVDGSILSAPFDSTKPSNDESPTEVMPSGVPLAETEAAIAPPPPAPTIPARISQAQEASSTRNEGAQAAAPPEQKPLMLWVVGGIALLALIGVAYVIFQGGSQTSNQSLTATNNTTAHGSPSPTPDQTKEKANSHFNKGMLFKEEKRYAEAETEFRESIRLNPDEPKTHLNLAFVLTRLGKHAEAEREYRETLRLRPNAEPHAAAAVRYNIGKALSDQKKYAEAEAEYREAIRLDPKLGTAHMNLGLVLYWQNKVEEAETELREAVRLNPNEYGSHYNLAIVLEELGKTAEARAEHAKAEQLKKQQ